jgi:hypothetical protein
MAMVLEKVVPFGRSFDEYTKMFNLTPADLAGPVIGIGDGPASFNAEATQQGFDIVSVDPIYTFSQQEINARFNAVVDDIINQVKATPEDWVWTYHKSPDELRANRVKALQTFLQDYEDGKANGRYITGELPVLPFAANSFSLALCSHLLFLYSEQLTYDFHVESIQEMLRIAPEVRIFPLLTLMLERSPHLEPVVQLFNDLGYFVAIVTVSYELQRGGNQMLIIRRLG